MKILALDTALNACSAAVVENGTVLAHRHEKQRRGHAEMLMPMIGSLMTEAALAYDDLDLIAVTVGPGTFTGLRIGLAAARGIALAAAKPITGVTTLEALAAAVPMDATQGLSIIATADARRSEVYLQPFLRIAAPTLIAPLGAPRAVPLSEAGACFTEQRAIIVGSGGLLIAGQAWFDATKYILLDLDEDPDAVIIAKLAASRRLPDPGAPPPAPLYLRAPDAKLPGGKDPALL
ncbi:MAG: tRNA (adenosine(37)-N6)-threonylcarbamoyltransferase complex dimerization subunit type 1 TsaB [Sneathiella sp.]|nr:tRNA (adenosine(37)-N6)-threonylcarbamoyltransferase complex dimerization subunit type 1 TsaB [Sneathiella sp.]